MTEVNYNIIYEDLNDSTYFISMLENIFSRHWISKYQIDLDKNEIRFDEPSPVKVTTKGVTSAENIDVKILPVLPELVNYLFVNSVSREILRVGIPCQIYWDANYQITFRFNGYVNVMKDGDGYWVAYFTSAKEGWSADLLDRVSVFLDYMNTHA